MKLEFTMKKALVAIGALFVPMLVAVSVHKSVPSVNAQERVSDEVAVKEKNPQDNFTLEFTQGIITAEIKDIPLEQVLSEMQKKTGIEVHFLSKANTEKKVTLSIKNAEPEHFFKAILGENYVFSFKQNPSDNKTFLKEVWVVSQSLKQARRIITKEISYGEGKENIGVLRGGEGANRGPASFIVDAKGNIYICDTVNKRIQVLSPEGKFLSSIPLNVEPEDIGSDRNGFLYVYADGTLYQHDRTGNLTSEVPIDQARWESRGPMHIVDNNVYITDGNGDLLIARIEDGKLISPSEQELLEPLENGFVGSGGKRYVGFPKDIEGATMEVIERDGTKSPRFIPIQRILSLEFLGEDKEGNSYLETEANNDDGISVAVSRFDVNGNYLDTIPIPENNYDFHAVKFITVGEDGTIYQMMPTKDRLILNSFLAN
jgi:hypothetical protein